jgi:hypothetical protein
MSHRRPGGRVVVVDEWSNSARHLPALLIVCAIGLLTSALPASAVTRAEVVHGLGVDRASADYVLLVDNSQSMRDKGLLEPVGRALGSLLRALKPQDHLTIVLFAKEPNVTWNDVVGTQLPAIRRALVRPTGPRTDIGAAIGQSLDVLERRGASTVARVVMLTDGGHHPASGSSYPRKTGPAWDALAARAAKLPASHNVESYAYALTSHTDARLLRHAFAHANVVSTPVDQLESTFRDQVAGQVEHAEALSALRDDRDAGVRISWPRELDDLDLARGTATGEVRLTSTARRLPIEVDRLAVASSGMDIDVDGAPQHLVLLPGRSTTFRIRLRFHPARALTTSITRTGMLLASAQLRSPWDRILTEELRVEPLTPRLRAARAPVTASASPRIPVGVVMGILVVALVIAALKTWRHRVADTAMDGTLQIQGPDGDVVAHDLGVMGKRSRVSPKGPIRLGEARGRIIGRTSVQDGEARPAVELQLRAGLARSNKHRFTDGQDRLVGDHTLTYWA